MKELDFTPDFSRPFRGAPADVRHKRENAIEQKAYQASLYGENAGLEACVCCGKAVRLDRPYWRVRVVEGGGSWGLTSERERTDGAYHESEDMGYFAVGPCCLRKVREACPGVDAMAWV